MRCTRLEAWIAAFVCVSSSRAAGQGGARVNAQADTAIAASCTPKADTLRDTVFATLAPARSPSVVGPAALTPALRVFVDRVHPRGPGVILMVSPLPAGAVIDTRTGAPSPNLPPVLATMPGEYALVLHRDGAVTGVRVMTSARVHGLDEAFTRALERIDDPPSGAVGPVYPSNLTDDSLPLRVRFTVGRESAAAAVPLSVRFVPITRLDRQPQLAAGNPKPSYPHIRSRVTDTVLVQFAVERTGRIDMETVRPIRAFAQVFLDPVLAILPKLRFEPALAGGCPTRTVIVQPFIIQPPAT